MYEFFQTVAAGLAVAGIAAIAGFLWRSDRRGVRTQTRLDSHEKICAERYSQIAEQNKRAEEHRESVTRALGTIGSTLSRVEENIRLRERQEDRN